MSRRHVLLDAQPVVAHGVGALRRAGRHVVEVTGDARGGVLGGCRCVAEDEELGAERREGVEGGRQASPPGLVRLDAAPGAHLPRVAER